MADLSAVESALRRQRREWSHLWRALAVVWVLCFAVLATNGDLYVFACWCVSFAAWLIFAIRWRRAVRVFDRAMRNE